MGKRERRIRRKCTQYLFGRTVMEGIEAAPQHFAVEGKDAAPGLRRRRSGVQICGMNAEGGLDLGDIKSTQYRADGGVRWRLLPFQPEGLVQALKVNPDESMDAPIGVCAGHDRQDREQQNIALLVALTLSAPWIGDRLEPG